MLIHDFDFESIEWMTDAECAVSGVPLEDYFPTPGHAPSMEALSACGRCPVRRECLAWAYKRKLAHGWFAGVAPTLRSAVPEDKLWATLRDSGG